MKKTSWILLGFCLIPFTHLAKAGADIVIYYDGRPGITYQNVPGLDYIFFELDQLRADMQDSLEAEVRARSSRIRSVDMSIKEDLTFEIEGLTGQRVRFTSSGFRSHLFFKYKCPVNIKKAKIDVKLSKAVVRTNYDLVSGTSPYHVDLHGFNIRLRPGISACTLATIYSFLFQILGIDLDDYLIDLFEDKFRDEIENALTNTFNLSGLGSSFLDLDPYIRAVPGALFRQVGLTRGEVLDVLRNPFSGIKVKVTLDEDGLGYNGDNDRLLIWIDVPWEQYPVATFNHTVLTDAGGFEVKFDASGSYDPDGGPVTFNWYVDNRTISSTNPVLYHFFPSGGTKAVILTVTDDEGVRKSDSQNINLCESSPFNFNSECLHFD